MRCEPLRLFRRHVHVASTRAIKVILQSGQNLPRLVVSRPCGCSNRSEHFSSRNLRAHTSASAISSSRASSPSTPSPFELCNRVARRPRTTSRPRPPRTSPRRRAASPSSPRAKTTPSPVSPSPRSLARTPPAFRRTRVRTSPTTSAYEQHRQYRRPVEKAAAAAQPSSSSSSSSSSHALASSRLDAITVSPTHASSSSSSSRALASSSSSSSSSS